jgi:DNA-binding CsgD family transcriptional regulator
VGSALVLSGEAGMGKSSLLRRGAAVATDLLVLTATGTEAEVAMPFAGLHALLSPLLPQLDDIPATQSAALSAVFALSAPRSVDTFVVAAGMLSLLAATAAGTPVLALVDDLHRLDQASRDAVLFVGRRLSFQGVGLICATQTDAAAATLCGLPHHRVGPLDRAASRQLLGRPGGRQVAPAVADQLVTAADGLPLALVELPTLLDPAELSGEVPLRNPLPVGPRVSHTYAPLLDGLAAASRRALVVAAAAGDLDLAGVLAAASRLDSDQAALEAAEAAGLIRLGGAGVIFRTPLLRSVVHQQATAAQWRQAHAALAEVTGADRRALHLALATLGPDEEVAGEVEALVMQESCRGGPAPAAQLMERAAGLSVAHDRRARRQAQAAELWQHAAAPGRVSGLLDQAIRLSSDLRIRGHVQAVRGRQELLGGRPLPAHRLLVHEAARVRAADPVRAATMLADAAQACCLAGQPQAGMVLARHAWLLTRQSPGLLTAAVAAQLAAVHSLLGDLVAARGLIDEWTGPLDDAAGDDAVPLEYRRTVQLIYPAVLVRLGELDRAWRVLDAALYQCRARRMAAQLPGLLAARAQLDRRLGEWESARAAAAEAVELARAASQQADEVAALVAAGWLAAGHGQADECRQRLGEARRICRGSGMDGYLVPIDAAEALLELGTGDAPAALARLEQVARRVQAGAAPDPGGASWAADLVEAAVCCGRPERARQVLSTLERQAVGSTTLPAVAARCRLVVGADPAELARPHQAPAGAPAEPFEAARTDLWLGVRLRDGGHPQDGRGWLLAAADAFDRLGARPWADRTRHELAAAGPEAEQLTAQEHRVAELVARGATNREVAGALFLSQKTIEFHLRNVFRKLGLRSRAQLAHLAGRAGGLPLATPHDASAAAPH